VLKQLHREQIIPLDTELLEKIAEQTDVYWIIFGEIHREGATVVLTLQGKRTKPGPIFMPSTFQFTVKTSGVGEAVRQATQSLLESIGADVPSLKITNSSISALGLLQKANELAAQAQWGKDPSVHRAAYKQAEGLLRLAIEKDSSLAMVHARLADILVSDKKYSEGYAEWDKAVQLTRTEPTSRDNLQILGQFYSDTGDYKNAEQTFRSYALLYPNDYLAWFYWGTSLDDLDLKEEAREKFQRALQLRPDSYVPHQHLASLYLLLGQFSEADREIEIVKSLGANEWVAWLEGHSAFLQGRYDEGVEKMRSLVSSQSDYWHSRGFSATAAFLAEQGKVNEALSLLQEGADYDQSTGRYPDKSEKLLAQAYIRWTQRTCNTARQLALDAVALENSPLRVLEAGTVLARCSFVKDAERLLIQLDQQSEIPRVQFAKTHLAVEITLTTKRTSRIVEDLSNPAFGYGGRPWETQLYLLYAFRRINDKDRAKATFTQLAESKARFWINSSQSTPGVWGYEVFNYLNATIDSDKSKTCFLLADLMSHWKTADPQIRGLTAPLNRHFQSQCRFSYN
jgi:tetratricopeptide (TPR) repeat protein